MKGIGGFCVWEMRGTVLSCVKKVPKNLRFGLEVGCFLWRGSWLKKGLASCVRASSPPASKPLFQFASQTRGRIRRCGGAIVKPARIAAAKRRSSASAITQYCGRPGRLCCPGARSAQKKRAETIGSSLLASVESTLFFDKPAVTSHPMTAFREGHREGLWAPKPPP